MSAQATEAIVLPQSGDAAFGALMDALAPEPEGAPAGAAAPEVGAPAGTAAAPAADANGGGTATPGQPGEGGAPASGAAVPAAGDAGGAAVVGDAGSAGGDSQQSAAAAGAGDRPASWTAPATDLIPKLGELSTALEKKTAEAYQTVALEEVRTEHATYFEALQKHPRLLVGTQVPAIGREGMETLRDTEDAKEWQDAVKSILVEEVRGRATKAMDENADFLSTVHSSISLFQENADLVPGTRDFDVELANRFATLAEPYELRVEGKLQGYSIPVQPIINQLRSQITAERAKTAATPPAAGGAVAPAAGALAPQAPAAPPADPPQAGIQSKAGSGSDGEDFSTLFGTIGMPNLRI